MSAKKKADKNRWRNKTLSFQMPPEIRTKLDSFVRISGLQKRSI